MYKSYRQFKNFLKNIEYGIPNDLGMLNMSLLSKTKLVSGLSKVIYCFKNILKLITSYV